MTKEEAIQKAHAMSAYIESEQADEKTHWLKDTQMLTKQYQETEIYFS